MKTLKKYELNLISHLRKNARESLTNLGRKINVPISTLYDRLQSHKKSLIKHFTILVDYQQLGFHSRATLIMKVKRDDREELKQFLISHKNVNSIFKINNGYDFMLDCIFRNIKDLEEFISELEESYRIKTLNVYYLIEEITQENFLANVDSMKKLFPEYFQSLSS